MVQYTKAAWAAGRGGPPRSGRARSNYPETIEERGNYDELGNIHISEEVLAAITAAAALEVDGVSGLAANLGSDIAELLGKKNLAKGVHVKMEDDKVEIELSVLMAYGHTIPDMGKAIQDSVKSAVESMTGLEVSAVNVNVGGITLP